jgi:hypothetical protein
VVRYARAPGALGQLRVQFRHDVVTGERSLRRRRSPCGGTAKRHGIGPTPPLRVPACRAAALSVASPIIEHMFETTVDRLTPEEWDAEFAAIVHRCSTPGAVPGPDSPTGPQLAHALSLLRIDRLDDYRLVEALQGWRGWPPGPST